MNRLRESVIIHTPGGDLQGELFVGADGLPELRLESDIIYAYPYRPATIPATWGPIVDADDERIEGPLLAAWRGIDSIRQAIAMIQRDAEAEERREPDCIDLAKAEMDARGER